MLTVARITRMQVSLTGRTTTGGYCAFEEMTATRRFDMQKAIVVGVMCFLLASVAATAAEEAPVWQFDKGHCNIYFDATHVYSIVRGRFEDYGGTFRFDPERPEASRFDITLKVKSIDTDHARRDKHLRSDDFFAAGEYPDIRFESTRVQRVQGNQFEAEGNLTIKDVTRQIRFPFTYLGTRPNPFNSKELVAGFESRFPLDRLAYRVGSGKYAEMGVVGKDVGILISLEMVRPR